MAEAHLVSSVNLPDTGSVLETVAGQADDVLAAIARSVRQRVAWNHIPLPIARDDDASFAPLQQLEWIKDAAPCLGLQHREDGVPDAGRRVDAARGHVERFSVASERGMGRTGAPQRFPGLPALHAETAVRVA